MFNAQAAESKTETKTLDKIYDQCVKKSGSMNNTVVSVCSDQASSAAKKQINLYYKQLYNRLLKDAPQDAKKLQEAQQAWIAYRDKHCALAGSYVGSPMYDYCPMQLNIARAAELQELNQ
ncbi:MAG: DUF1311 domain-containing protein [Moraxellaceae bacterium]|nr:MAG: DUF1311 domain-containing protein [Moraxellaceae bacterium]